MSLTRKLLRELRLDDDAVERVIAAHIETVDAIRAERDEAQSAATRLTQAAAECDDLRRQVADLAAARDDAARIQADFDAYRAQVDADRLAASRQAILRSTLLDAGANPQAVDLLASAANAPDAAWNGDALLHPDDVIAPLRDRYATLFARPVALPTPLIAPPAASAGPLTRDDVGRMSEQEILANWGAVQSALRG